MYSTASASRQGSVLTPAEEARQVIETETRSWQADSKEPAFLIAVSWWESWAEYTGFQLVDDSTPVVKQSSDSEGGSARPAEINNDDLSVSGAVAPPILRNNLQEGKDYRIVLESTWNLLHHWYGGGPAFVRQWLDGPKPYVEVYALQLTIKRHSDQKEETLFISRKAKKSELKTKACQLVGLKEADVRMWDYYQNDLYANLDEQLEDGVEGPLNTLNDKQPILLEEKNAAGKFLLQPKSHVSPLILRNRSFQAPPDSTFAASGRGHGLAGLSNLGNTCFMNSSIQSLAHTVPLMRKFLRHNFGPDVNTDNPLGMNGKLAEAFGGLMDKLWQGDTASVSPSNFKYQLGKFAPQFQGYGQQDSQELLAFLLDGLHEDLNRIKRKPYIEEKDANGRPDEEVAAEAWHNYRMRNDSSIVDHFQGLYKSTLICPMDDCQYHSIKFDPFMYLSLPLPDRRQRHFEVTVVHLDGSKSPTRYSVGVSITGKVRDLYQAVAKVLQLPPQDPQKLLLLAEYDSRQTLTMHTKGSEPLTSVSITNGPGTFSSSRPLLLAYHYASPEQGPASGKQLLVYHRQRKMKSLFNMGYGGGEEFSDKFAPPLVLFMAEENLAELPVQQVEIASAPHKWNYEYVVEPTSCVNAALETALRPFKRPRPPVETDSSGNSDGHQRVVRSRLSDPVTNDDDLTEAPAMQAPDNSKHTVSEVQTHSPSLQKPEQATATVNDQYTNGFGNHHSQNGGHGEAIWSPDEIPVSNDHAARADLQSSVAATANGHAASSDNTNGDAKEDGDSHGAASHKTNSSIQKTSAEEQEPLQRMSWMQGSPPKENGTSGQSTAATNGHATSQADANAVDEDDTVWEPVQNGHTQDGTIANGFSTPLGKLGTQASDEGQAPKSIIPTIQPFNMFAAQAATGSSGHDAAAQQAEHTEPPYTLKWANQMGDVRLTSKPPSPEQKVLYFTAQWERDGGGMYDVSKFLHPEEDESVQKASGQTSSTNRDTVQLEACLQAFQTSEELEAEDSWFCSKCKRHVQANKKLDLWTTPEVLVVHLKRFFFTRLRRDKLDVKVEFPLENWDLSAYLPPHQEVPPVYDLYAVSNHFGGMGGGHYNAYCKMPNGQWHCFDDSHVHPVDQSEIVSSSAYVLFYRRQHEAQQDPADLLDDIVPLPEDITMADAQPHVEDEDTSLPSPLPLIVASDPNAGEDDRTTQDISEVADPAEALDETKDEAASSHVPMHAVATADGAIFMMEDIPLRRSLGGDQSDVSMPAASETEQPDNEQHSAGLNEETAQNLLPGSGAHSGNAADEEDAASNEADTGGRSEVEDLDMDQFSDAGKTSLYEDDLQPREDLPGAGQV